MTHKAEAGKRNAFIRASSLRLFDILVNYNNGNSLEPSTFVVTLIVPLIDAGPMAQLPEGRAGCPQPAANSQESSKHSKSPMQNPEKGRGSARFCLFQSQVSTPRYSRFVKRSQAFSHPCSKRHMNDIGANRSGTHAET
jgi:hypothetical protein